MSAAVEMSWRGDTAPTINLHSLQQQQLFIRLHRVWGSGQMHTSGLSMLCRLFVMLTRELLQSVSQHTPRLRPPCSPTY